MVSIKNIPNVFVRYIVLFAVASCVLLSTSAQTGQRKILINEGWRFTKGDPSDGKGLFYDVRPIVMDRNDNIVADTRANQTNLVTTDSGLKKWILPSANDFIKDASFA